MEPYDELIQPISVCDRCLAITFGFTETRLGLPLRRLTLGRAFLSNHAIIEVVIGKIDPNKCVY